MTTLEAHQMFLKYVRLDFTNFHRVRSRFWFDGPDKNKQEYF